MIDCFFSNAEFELSWSEVVYNIISLQTTEHTHIHFHQCYKHTTQSSSNVYIINCHNFFCLTESVKLEMQDSCANMDLTLIFMQKKTENFYFLKQGSLVLV